MALDDRKLDVLRAIVEDYVATQEPVGSKALVERHQLGVSPGHGPQRHGGAGGGGLHPAAAHQRRPGAHRPRLPAVRRPALPGQAAQPRRAAGHRAVPGRRGRPRRRGAPHGTAARAADPPGGRGAVPEPGPLVRAPPRAGADLHHPADARHDRRHRAGRAAAGRDARRRSTADDVTDAAAAGQREARRQRLVGHPAAGPGAGRRVVAGACARRWRRCRRCCWRRWSSGTRSGSRWPARPT